MDEPNVSGSEDKPWDYPWTTDEMRQKRREWSLAADAGLLKHLENFHNTITKRAKQTEEDLSSLTNQLNQTAILVDNVTNTSLALANNQFVESRVQEDDVEISKPASNDVEENKDHELSASELIATVSETILKGLQIMDEKYEKVEVVDSDSEDEAENTVPSVILKPKDPYQDRPLPYIIGTEKWKTSTKIGLEYSSSEDSEQEEEEEDENDSSESEGGISKAAESPKMAPKMMIHKQISSSLSGSDDFEVEREKVGEVYNATEPSTESITPSSLLPKNQINGPPSFAEELAKRLGNVLPEQKVKDRPVISKVEDEESLFSPESEPEVEFSDRKTDNLFSESANLFDDDWSEDKQRPSRSEDYAAKVKNNFIPVSNDLPPPINEISSKPKLEIDDLFGDVDSDDSDDIFTPKSFKKSDEPMKIPEKEILSDDDDEFLFSNQKSTLSKDSVKKVPPGGVSIFGNIEVIPNSLAGKFPGLQRHLSSSSEDDTPTPVSKTATLEPKPKSMTNKTEIDGNRPTSMAKKTEPSNIDRSAISKSAVPQFVEPSNLRTPAPPMTPATKTDSVAIDINKRKNENIFDDDEDDLFGPPPLPKTASSQKQKVTSIFDDSDSDKDLFDPGSRPAPKTTSIFDDDDNVLFADATSVIKKDPSGFEQVPEIKQQKKNQRSIFDDSDEEDIFAPPKPTTSVAKTLSLPKAEPPKNTSETEPDEKMESELEAKMESEPETELEKAKTEEPELKPEETVPDGAVISKKSSPVSMGVRMFPTLPLDAGIPKRPVSDKIKNLMGRMGGLKILSPTDTPPLVRKKDDSDEDSASLPSTSPVNSDDPTIKKSPSVLKRENSEENAESAVSFDEPVKSETLSSASKNRARLPTKRRPQSRHARHSALRHSGIDFDVADAPRLVEPDRENSENTISDRLTMASAKSSTNKNTLRSPSTDEEDLFDMPPDLPEDTLREDPLFGRAPILSPSESPETKDEPDGQDEENKSEDEKDTKQLDEKGECVEEEIKPPKDPLRDTSHDPLQDPSQFFAFVTRTPSPEKAKIIFNDDDSLFSTKSQPEKEPKNNSVSAQSSIFDDDDDSDLFSKSFKRPLVDKKVSLFDDDEEDDNDDLFGSKMSSSKEDKEKETGKRKIEMEEGEEETEEIVEKEEKKLSAIFDDDEDVFGLRKDGARKKEMTGSNLKDIFGDQSSGDEDLFSNKSGVRKKSEESEKVKEKKVKDLKKTAEKISKDPLSLLQDD